AAAGSTIAVAAEARDFAGNKARALADVPVSSNQDTTPPVLTFSAPDQVRPGASIALSATATDATGVAAVVFIVDGVVVGSAVASPYEATYVVPSSLPAGAHLTLEARA